MNYFININGVQRGPFAPEQLPAQGVGPDTLVWGRGMPQWERADRIAELRPMIAHLTAVMPGQPYPGQPTPIGSPGGYAATGGYAPPDTNKLAAGLCGIFLGAFGIHKFLLGYTTAGIIMLVVSVTCVGYPIMHLIGLIEGIIYLTKNDAEFYQEYVVNRKEWF